MMQKLIPLCTWNDNYRHPKTSTRLSAVSLKSPKVRGVNRINSEQLLHP